MISDFFPWFTHVKFSDQQISQIPMAKEIVQLCKKHCTYIDNRKCKFWDEKYWCLAKKLTEQGFSLVFLISLTDSVTGHWVTIFISSDKNYCDEMNFWTCLRNHRGRKTKNMYLCVYFSVPYHPIFSEKSR